MTRLAWSDAFDHGLGDVAALPLPQPTRRWAFDSADGRGVKVAVIDSGVDSEHPRVGGLAGAVAFEPDDGSHGGYRAVEGTHHDLVGHGTACAAIIRRLAPAAEIYSVRVLGPSLRGRNALLFAGIQWAIDAGMDVANLSLSSSSSQWFAPLHDAADHAYFRRLLLVCAANNLPGPTYPSQYASVISVAAHRRADPYEIACNPSPPVEFGALGIDVDVAWGDGTSMVATGNSFAAAHVTGLSALIASKHRGITPAQMKSVLQSVAVNAR